MGARRLICRAMGTGAALAGETVSGGPGLSRHGARRQWGGPMSTAQPRRAARSIRRRSGTGAALGPGFMPGAGAAIGRQGRAAQHRAQGRGHGGGPLYPAAQRDGGRPGHGAGRSLGPGSSGAWAISTRGHGGTGRSHRAGAGAQPSGRGRGYLDTGARDHGGAICRGQAGAGGQLTGG